MDKAKIIIKDECNIKIENLEITTKRKCINALKFFVPNARFIANVRFGYWDGSTSFFSAGGNTYLNLLDRILPIITEDGYDIEVEDLRKKYSFNFSEIDNQFLSNINWPSTHPTHANQPIILFDHQVDIINNFTKNLHGIVVAATAAGKSITTGCLSKIIEPYGRSLIIVPSQNLVDQTAEEYKLIGLDTGVFYGPKKNYDNQHIVSTWQGLNALVKKAKNNEDNIDVDRLKKDLVCVIVDECHGQKAEALKKLMAHHFSNVPIRWGLTGTMPKEEIHKVTITSVLGPVVHTIMAHELQEKGILANCHIDIIQTEEKIKCSSYHAEHDHLLTDDERIKFLAKTIYEKSKDGNTLVLIDRIKAGEKIAKSIEDNYTKDVVFLSGGVGKDDRKVHYDQVRIADSKIIIATSGIAAVGINMPRIFNLILLEPGKSFIRTIQSIGRGLRKAEDKDFVNIIDIASTAKFSAKHLRERIKYYEEAKYPYTKNKIRY